MLLIDLYSSTKYKFTVRPTHLDFFFGMIDIWRLFFEFSSDGFEFLRDFMDPGAKVLFYFSGFLNFSLFGKNLDHQEEMETNATRYF